MAKMLEYKGVTLRGLEPTDVDYLTEWEGEQDAWDTSNTLVPYSRYTLWQYLENFDSDIFKTKELRLMILADGVEAGTVDIFNLDVRNRRAEVGVYVSSSFRRQGVMQRAMAVLEHYAHDVLGVHQLYCTVSSENVQAQKSFVKAGFSQVAILPHWLRRGGDYVDALVYQKIID